MPESRQIGYGIVGAGSIADFHARAIAMVPGAKLCAVSSRTVEGAARVATAHGAVAAASLDELLARTDIDVVCVTAPSGVHGEIAIAALQAGKHVLCEKPLEITTARVDAILAAAQAAHRHVGVVLPSRLGDGASAVAAAVRAGRLGRMTLASAYVKWWRTDAYYAANRWRGTWALDGGGALMNQGIHGVDLLLWLAGVPEQLNAFAATLAHGSIEVEDTLVASLHFPGGALGSIECATSCAPGTSRRIELCGSRGSITLEDDAIVRWDFDEARPEDAEIKARMGRGALGSGAADPRAIGVEGHRRVIADMTEAVRNGRPPIVPGAEGRKSVALIEAIYTAARTRQSQRVR